MYVCMNITLVFIEISYILLGSGIYHFSFKKGFQFKKIIINTKWTV